MKLKTLLLGTATAAYLLSPSSTTYAQSQPTAISRPYASTDFSGLQKKIEEFEKEPTNGDKYRNAGANAFVQLYGLFERFGLALEPTELKAFKADKGIVVSFNKGIYLRPSPEVPTYTDEVPLEEIQVSFIDENTALIYSYDNSIETASHRRIKLIKNEKGALEQRVEAISPDKGPFFPYDPGLEVFDFEKTYYALREIKKLKSAINNNSDDKWTYLADKESWITSKFLEMYGIQDTGLHYHTFSRNNIITIATARIDDDGIKQIVLTIRSNLEAEMETIELGERLQTGKRQMMKIKPVK